MLGIWNIWIFFIPGFGIIQLAAMWANRKRGDPIEDPEAYEAHGKKLHAVSLVWLAALVLICLFTPLNSGAVFWTGLPLWMFGIIVNLVAIHSFAHSTAEVNTTGIYRYSRNPMYVGMFFLLLGISVMGWSTSVWSIALLGFTIVSLPYLHWTVLFEEAFLTRKYGDSYREYMNRTGRYVPLPRKLNT